MNTEWTRGLSKEAKEEFKTFLMASGKIFDRLDTILDSNIDKELSSACGKDDFVGDWANKQAYLMGKINAYRSIKDLIKDLTS